MMMQNHKKFWNQIVKQFRTPMKDNKGSAIVMVLVSMAFVGIMASMLMFVTYNNYRMKITDYKAKDNFYSAEMAMDEIRAGVSAKVYEAFSVAYQDTMMNYGNKELGNKNVYFKEAYVNNMVSLLASANNSEKYDLELLRGFVTQPATAKGELGAYVDSDSCYFLKYEDGIRMKDIVVTYTDEQGYVSIIESDILLAFPELGIQASYEFPDLNTYCIIADEKFVVDRGHTEGVKISGSIYGGQEGIVIDAQASCQVEGYTVGLTEEQKKNGEADAWVITDGVIALGKEAEEHSTRFTTTSDVSLWAAGITVDGIKKATTAAEGVPQNVNYNLALLGETYLQDDLTINATGAAVKLGGTYTGFGNANTKAEKSSSIIVNGPNTILDMKDLEKLSLGGNAYIGTSTINKTKLEGDYAGIENKDIKMGNAVATKAEQLAYLIPIECIGYDAVNKTTVVGRNPVNVKDAEYQQFLAKEEQNPEQYKEVNLSLVDKKVKAPLSSYGATYEKVYYKPDNENIWVYYYLKFSSALEAGRFFKDYYTANPEDLNRYINNYVRILDTGSRDTLSWNLMGNMITKDANGNFKLVEATVGEDVDKVVAQNKEYAEISNQFVGLCKKLTINYGDLTGKERRAGVYYNTINTEYIQKCKSNGTFKDKYVVFKNDTADTYVLLILKTEGEAEDTIIDLDAAIAAAGLSGSESKIHLVISEQDLNIRSLKFDGTIIVDGVLTVTNNNAKISVMKNMDNVLLSSYTSQNPGTEGTVVKAVSLFREGKDTEIADGTEAEEGKITTKDLVYYENWTKR